MAGKSLESVAILPAVIVDAIVVGETVEAEPAHLNNREKTPDPRSLSSANISYRQERVY